MSAPAASALELDRQFLQAVRRRPAGELVRVQVPPLQPLFLRAGTSAILIFRQLFIRRELDFPLPGAPAVIIDAGANIGLASLYFAARFPQARILALEVEPSNFRMLTLNTRDYPQVTPLL